MRLLCVGRHAFLSEHLCRFFRDYGVDCASAVGASDALRVAADYEPHLVVCDCDLITPSLLNEWAVAPSVAEIPLLAVSLTRRPEDVPPVELSGIAGVIYLPSLNGAQVRALLSGAYRRRGVLSSHDWRPIVVDRPISTYH